MRSIGLSLLALVYFGLHDRAYAASPVDGIGVELRQYLLGTIPEAVGRMKVGDQTELSFGAGVDLIYHGDQGVQDHESGLGYGISGGLRTYRLSPVFLGLRLDAFKTSINWTNHSNPTLPASGTSNLLVLQPTVEVGSNFVYGNLSISPALSVGTEVNTFVEGAPTGQGLILLLGIAVIWSGHDQVNANQTHGKKEKFV